MSHLAESNIFNDLIDVTREVERLGGGFEFTEGPIWHPVEEHLSFSDIPGNARYQWDSKSGFVEAMKPSNKCNGMTYDRDLNLLVCEHETSRVVIETPRSERITLASCFEGVELNSPNDVCVHSDGSIYFSDPWYGRMAGLGIERPRELGWQGVFRIHPGCHEATSIVDKRLFDMPNGLCFSPDESKFYVNDTVQCLIRSFDVAEDGSLRNMSVFAHGIFSEDEPGVPDGMKCDEEGNVWVCAPGGIWVYSPEGKRLGKVRVPELVANFHWGGPDWRTLFITATSSIYTLRTKIGPRIEPFMENHIID